MAKRNTARFNRQREDTKPKQKVLPWDDQTFGAWADARKEEIEQNKGGMDSTLNTYLSCRWQGVYTVRLLPTLDSRGRDWMVQSGRHYNVFPNDENDNIVAPGCPQFTYGEDCPICFAINKQIATRGMKFSDFSGKDSMLTYKRYLVRVLLLDFEPGPKEDDAVEFTELPAIKVMALPYKVQQTLTNKLADRRRYGPEALLHPERGKAISIEKNSQLQGWWDVDILPKSEPIPEEFLNTDEWPRIEDFLPEEHTEQLMNMVLKQHHDIPELISSMALSIDVGPSKPKAAKKTRRVEEEEPEDDPEDENEDDDEKSLEEKLENI